MLSIIIPTLNEENYLPRLLKSIKNQRFNDYEIIVADARSEDETREIAKKFGCKITKGGLPGKGRNEGAKRAKGDSLLFLDADVVLPDDFLKKTLKEFKERKLDLASFLLQPKTQKRFFRFLFNFFYNWPILILGKFSPHGAMGILIKKSLHKRINGFNEKIKLCEDHDYLQRGGKIGKFGILKSPKIFFSLRRFKTEGWIKTYLKYILVEFHLIFIGPIKRDIFNYKFNHYSKKSSTCPPSFDPSPPTPKRKYPPSRRYQQD